MASLPELVAFRERLIEATYSGVRSVQDATGERIEYRSQRELMAALQSINRAIQVRESELGCSRIVYPVTSKGL